MDAKTEIINYVTEIVDIQTLTPNPKNPRQIKGNDFERLKKQILKLKQYKPIIVDKRTGFMIGGHMRLEALKSLNQTKVLVSYIESKDDQEAFEYMLSDNDNAGYTDADMLANMIPQYPTLDWKDYAVTLEPGKIIADLLPKNTIEDEVPAIDETQTSSKLGEVYQLGRHRLMCGDATKIEDVEKLMNGQKADMVFTDPPYGVSYGDKNVFLNAIGRPNSIQENIDNDTKPVKEMKQLWTDAFVNMHQVTKAGGSYYVCSPQGGELMMMMMSLLEAGWQLKQSIIWVKNNHVLGRSDYHYRHEPLLYGWKEGEAHKFYGGSGETTTWFIDRPNMSELHPTMKPLQLVVKAISNSSKGDDIILDPFLGSGSTLIASEQTNRSCYGLELDPKYVDVCRKRYAKFIGKEEQWQTITPIL